MNFKVSIHHDLPSHLMLSFSRYSLLYSFLYLLGSNVIWRYSNWNLYYPWNFFSLSTMSPHVSPLKVVSSRLFEPLAIGNGMIKSSHWIFLALITRNRGVPLNPDAAPANPNRTWISYDLQAMYYTQRMTPGGLLITEELQPSIESGAMPGVLGWIAVVDAVHVKGSYIYAQIWHAGRASIPLLTGLPTVSAIASSHEGDVTCK